ncbi:rod shape-determining protein RodA [Enterobacteriaceae endosymbiont of Donacia tomentosa]|uniref:rod shape-determining protein RodA n=1 Tax=Enterobacteriaceae endosymbiont of Donacia tomentosa TaxID=2675787 RepID=UPI001448A9EF|nr:rod shape-determining protein RodA [Enterobacteriaceae endosymbiont of Donacia tomentosa]QJC31727.1 rod shape-determining protein RodA [Enterobacteriaceae endosymbiont of Donacia tomentosa]
MLIKNVKKFMYSKLHTDPILVILIILILILSLIITSSVCGIHYNLFRNKLIQICIGLVVMMISAQIPPYIYKKGSVLFYLFCVILLIIVHIMGHTSKGAQRWLDLGFLKFQPSEIVKIAVPLIIMHIINDKYPIDIKTFFKTIIIISIPCILVAKQPDLGTAILISMSGLIVLFLSGLSWLIIINSFLLLIICTPVIWFLLLHDYQKERILILLNPERDFLGKGYHIVQSKIAIGSGGLFGKGWKYGTQTQLGFLPEKYTDFIFSALAEEFGFLGVLLVITLYTLLISRGLYLALQTKNLFGKIMISEIILIFFLCVFINIGMVSGLVPVVGIPLPLISYGGSSLIVFMANFGIAMSIYTHDK